MIKTQPLAGPSELTALKLSQHVINEIKVDMRKGYVPVSCSTFSELHDHVDANEYLINALELEGIAFLMAGDNITPEEDAALEAQAAVDNRVMDIVNVWLAAR
jgi:hypothetical protein